MIYNPRVLVFNQYYPPDSSATANRVAEMADELASQYQITVICGRPSYDPFPDYLVSGRISSSKVLVLRVPSTAFYRSWMLGRLLNYLSYLVLALIAGLGQERPSFIVAHTDPPLIGLVAWIVAKIKGSPLVCVIHDVHPDAAVVLGKIKSPLLISMLNTLLKFFLHRASRIVALSASMKKKLIEKGADPAKVMVISNWADEKFMVPMPKINSFSVQHNLSQYFVVMYSGNMGLSQNLDLLIHAAKALEDIKDLRVVLIGEGASKARVMNLAQETGVKNVVFLPYQPAQQMAFSFAAADVFLVPLAAGLDGLLIPSKVFFIMASARPFIAIVDDNSEAAEIARRFSCGVVVKPGQGEDLIEAVRWFYGNREKAKIMGQQARVALEKFYSRTSAARQYNALFQEVAALS